MSSFASSKVGGGGVVGAKRAAAPSVILDVAEWDVQQTKYMMPKINKNSGKSISILSALSVPSRNAAANART